MSICQEEQIRYASLSSVYNRTEWRKTNMYKQKTNWAENKLTNVAYSMIAERNVVQNSMWYWFPLSS